MKQTTEEIIAVDFKYEKIQEGFELINRRIAGDEGQERLLDYLSDFRQMNKEILRQANVFYVEDKNEINFLTGYDEDTQYYLGFLSKNVSYEGRFVFPMRNGFGELNGWIGYDSDSTSKYMVGLLGVGDKKKLMYGIDDIDLAFEEDTIIVNEGLFERLRLKEIGLNVGVSLLGKKMSKWHKQYLNRFKNVILIPDGDIEGQDMINQWREGLTSNVCVIKLKEEMKKFFVFDEWIEKKAKDLDDKLRGDIKKQEEFKELYSYIKETLKNEKYMEVSF